MENEEVLGKVEDAYIEIEDHGILTCWVQLDKEDGFHQAFGGYSLDSFDKDEDRRIGTAAGLDYILRLLQIFGVSKLEDIKGKMCYALYDGGSQTLSRTIKGLRTLKIDGNETFLIKDWQEKWFPGEADKF